MGDFPTRWRAVRHWEPLLAGASVQDVIQLELLSLLLAVPLLPGGRGRVLAASAAIGAGLGLAGLRAGPAGAMVTLPPGFLAVQAVGVLAGALLALAAAALSARA